MRTSSYQDLIVWRKSMLLVKHTYTLTNQFPSDEKFGLASQMQRAVVSIPSNIAEGHLRNHKKEYIQFLSVALGSAAELQTQTLICKDLSKFEKLDFTQIESLLSEIMKMLFVMIRTMST